MNEMCERHDLLDLFRAKHPNEIMHTFVPGGNNVRQIYRRLDYFFISSPLIKQCLDLETVKLISTDHCALSFSLKQTEQTINKGIWRHNDSLLKDTDYIDFLKNEITMLNIPPANSIKLDGSGTWDL